MADEEKKLDMSPELQAFIDGKINEITNAYDKKLKKHVAEQVQPALDQLKAEMKKGPAGMKPKKLAKLLRRIEEAKAGKAAENKEKPDDATAVAAAAAAAAASKDKTKNKDNDLFKKRVAEEFEARIAALETDKAAAEGKAAQAEMMSALDRALSDLPWASLESRDMAREYYAPKVKRDDDGQFLIGDSKMDVHIKAEIPSKFENLLATKKQGGAGIQKGTGKGPTIADAMEALGPNSTAAEKAAAATGVAALMGA